MKKQIVSALLLLAACSSEDRSDGGTDTGITIPDAEAKDAETIDADPVDADPIDADPVDAQPEDSGVLADQLPPTNTADLIPWLQAGTYTAWAKESAVHDSTGPHFGNVRTYINDALDGSLAAGNTEHPMGAAAVKELYGMSGSDVRGWSVLVKTESGSGGGRWWCFERFGSSTYASGQGATICTDCHDGGNDEFLSPYPLQ